MPTERQTVAEVPEVREADAAPFLGAREVSRRLDAGEKLPDVFEMMGPGGETLVAFRPEAYVPVVEATGEVYEPSGNEPEPLVQTGRGILPLRPRERPSGWQLLTAAGGVMLTLAACAPGPVQATEEGRVTFGDKETAEGEAVVTIESVLAENEMDGVLVAEMKQAFGVTWEQQRNMEPGNAQALADSAVAYSVVTMVGGDKEISLFLTIPPEDTNGDGINDNEFAGTYYVIKNEYGVWTFYGLHDDRQLPGHEEFLVKHGIINPVNGEFVPIFGEQYGADRAVQREFFYPPRPQLGLESGVPISVAREGLELPLGGSVSILTGNREVAELPSTLTPGVPENAVDHEALNTELVGYSREELVEVPADVWQRLDSQTLTPDDVKVINEAMKKVPGLFVAEDSPLRAEAEQIKQSLLEYSKDYPEIVQNVAIGTETVVAPEGNEVELVMVRNRETGQILMPVDGWGDHEGKWVAAEVMEGTTQMPLVMTDAWAEVTSDLNPLPQAGVSWTVAYMDADGNLTGQFFFAWRDQGIEGREEEGRGQIVGSEWSLKGLYVASRMHMPDKFRQIIWVEPPDVPTGDRAVEAYINLMIAAGKFTDGAGKPVDENYIRQALELVKTMPTELQAFVLSDERPVRFEGGSGSMSYWEAVRMNPQYLNYGFGPDTLEYLANTNGHEAVHGAQQLEHPACVASDNVEFQSWYLTNYGWLGKIRGVTNELYSRMFRENSYPTCAG